MVAASIYSGGEGMRLASASSVPMSMVEKSKEQVVFKEDPWSSQGSASQVTVQANAPARREETHQTPTGVTVTQTETREVLNPMVTPAQATGPAVIREEKLPPIIHTKAYEVFRKDPSTLYPGSKIISVGKCGPVTTASGCVYDPIANTITSAFTGQVTPVEQAHHIGSTLGKWDIPTTMGNPPDAVAYSTSAQSYSTTAQSYSTTAQPYQQYATNPTVAYGNASYPNIVYQQQYPSNGGYAATNGYPTTTTTGYSTMATGQVMANGYYDPVVSNAMYSGADGQNYSTSTTSYPPRYSNGSYFAMSPPPRAGGDSSSYMTPYPPSAAGKEAKVNGYSVTPMTQYAPTPAYTTQQISHQ